METISQELKQAIREQLDEAVLCWQGSGEVEKIAEILYACVFKEVNAWKRLSATEVCADNPQIAEYVKSLEERVSDLEDSAHNMRDR